jgi:cyclohexanone monooxygenase
MAVAKAANGNGAGDRLSDYDAIIVGAGASGLYALHCLRRLGLRVRVYESGSGIGGTWFWNRYPGARCDVESLEYSYGFSNELQQEWRWPDRYSIQPDILRYFNFVADKFNLWPDIQFNTQIVSQTYDETANLWRLVTDKGESLSARYCIMASGNLSTPRVPDFKGLENFKGAWYHSARWPQAGVDFTGQRVALIGTGATGVQMVPKIAPQARHLYVMQRTANFSIPARNGPLSDEADRKHKARYPEYRKAALNTSFGMSSFEQPTKGAMDDTPEERQRRYEARWEAGGSINFLLSYDDALLSGDSNETAAEFVRNKIRSVVQDAKTAELLCPKDHPIGSKRLCVDTNYYETFNLPNVSLVDVRSDPIQAITETGVQTRDAHYEVDAIAFATGFDAITGALLSIDIRGRGGVRLADRWKHGPLTYLGLMVARFPNMFIITGPGSPSVKSNMIVSIEQHVNWIADCLSYMGDRQKSVIEAEEADESKWVDHVNDVANRTLYPQADSWYTGANIPGKPRIFMPYVGGIPAYRRKCDAVVANDYEGFRLE